MDLYTGAIAPGTNTSKSSVQDSESLRRICQDFESVFITYLMQSMRKTIPKSDWTTEGSSSIGFSEDVYLSMMDEKIASAVSKANGIGLAAVLYRQLSQSKID